MRRWKDRGKDSGVVCERERGGEEERITNITLQHSTLTVVVMSVASHIHRCSEETITLTVSQRIFRVHQLINADGEAANGQDYFTPSENVHNNYVWSKI